MASENATLSSMDRQFQNAREYAAKVKAAFLDFRAALGESGAKNWIQPGSRAKLDELIGRLEAIEVELANPALKIAMIGTTSSGKSTLLNAMIGRRLAPIEAGEMSAGVVSIRHGEKLSMLVKETQGMAWPAGDYQVQSDAEIYDAMRDSKKGIMALYRAACATAKEGEEILAPQIDITAPLAPKCGGIPDFEFPESIDLQFFDLPGLKSEKDRKNLQIIQQYLKNAFLIVVLNYGDTDTDKREKLLQEIYENVIAVCKNKDAVLYVLNKIDQRSKNDDPIEDRCREMREAIKNKLKLENPPVVLPVSALPLFYVQVAFGVYGLERQMEGQDPEFASEQLNNFFEDCSKSIKNMRRDSAEKKSWFNDHDEDSDGDWNPEEIYRLLGWTYEESKVRTIWDALAVKLHEYLGSVIIAPIFGNFFSELQSFVASLNDQERILGLATEDEIRKEKDDLVETVEKMNVIIKKFETDLIANLQSALKSLQAKSQDINQDAVNTFYMNQRNTMRDIRNDLVDTVARPPLDYLDSADVRCAQLEAALKEVLAPDMASRIARWAESLRNHGYTVEMARTGAVETFREQEAASNENYIRMQKLKGFILGLYWQMKQAFVKRGEYLLQAHINEFSGGVQKLLQNETRNLFNDLSIVLGNKHSTLRPYEIKDFQVEIQLPEDVFIIPDDIASAKYSETESYTVETGSCYKSAETRFRDVGMIREELPAVSTMRKQWEDGIEKGENAIWEKMFQAIEKITIDEIIRIGDNLDNNAKLLESALNKQFELVRQDKESFIKAAHESVKPLNDCARASQEYRDALIGEGNGEQN